LTRILSFRCINKITENIQRRYFVIYFLVSDVSR